MTEPTRLSCVNSLLCASALALAISAGAPAQAALDYSYSGDVAFASDYIWRGSSQTGRNPAVQGGYSLDTNVGFSVGIWGSNISFSDSAAGLESEASLELDTFISGAFSLSEEWGIEIGYLDYHYPGDSSLNFAEVFFSASGLGASIDIAFSDDYEGLDDDHEGLLDPAAVWFQVGYEYSLVPDLLSLGAEYGRVTASDAIFVNGKDGNDNTDAKSFNHSSLYLAFRFETFELKALVSSSSRPGCVEDCDGVSSIALTKSF